MSTLTGPTFLLPRPAPQRLPDTRELSTKRSAARSSGIRHLYRPGQSDFFARLEGGVLRDREGRQLAYLDKDGVTLRSPLTAAIIAVESDRVLFTESGEVWACFDVALNEQLAL